MADDSFQRSLEDNNLFGLGFRGNPFTFSNRRRGVLEYKARLDRVLANAPWRNTFKNTTVDHIATSTSDHYMLLIDCLCNQHIRKVKHFRFELMWLREKSFHQNLVTFWPSEAGQDIPIREKLNKCADNIKQWNKFSFGSVRSHIKKLRSLS